MQVRSLVHIGNAIAHDDREVVLHGSIAGGTVDRAARGHTREQNASNSVGSKSQIERCAHKATEAVLKDQVIVHAGLKSLYRFCAPASWRTEALLAPRCMQLRNQVDS